MTRSVRCLPIAAALLAGMLISPASAQMSSTDLIVRLERLENQVRQLTGAIEQLQFRNQQLEQQLRRTQEDAEFRFQELGQQRGGIRPGTQGRPPQAQPGAIQPAAPPGALMAPGAAPPLGPVAAPPLPAPAPGPTGRRSDAFDPAQDPSAPGTPRTLGTLAGPTGRLIDDDPADLPPLGAPGGRGAGAPLDLATLSARQGGEPPASQPMPPGGLAIPPGSAGPLPPPPPRNPNATGAQPQQMTLAPSNTPKDEYDLAYGYMLRKEYPLAEQSFREFLKKYPSDRLASDATYWLGESLFQRQRHRDAAEHFLHVSSKHASSARAPDSLLRLGQSLAALKETQAACATFAEIGRKYPRASPTVRQTAEREQKRVGC